MQVCVCVCGPSTGSVPRPRRCETRRSLRGSGALSCSVWHFGLPDAHRWRARTRAAAGGNVCSTVHSSDRLPSATNSIEKWTRRRPIPVTKLIHKSRVCVYSLPIPTLASLSGAERRRDPIGSRTVACRCARPPRGREGSIPW